MRKKYVSVLWGGYSKGNKTSSELQGDANHMVDVMCGLNVKKQLDLLRTFGKWNGRTPPVASDRVHLFKNVILKLTGRLIGVICKLNSFSFLLKFC